MRNISCMNQECTYPAVGVVETDDELLEDPPSLLLGQSPVGAVAKSVVEQVPPLRILHRYRQVRGCQEHLRAHAGMCFIISSIFLLGNSTCSAWMAA